MPHRFDSGLDTAFRTAIRGAALAKLAPLRRSSGGYLGALVELPAPLRFGSDEDEAALNDLIAGNSPAVGIALGNQRFSSASTSGERWRSKLLLTVYVCVRHQRSMMAALAGDVVSAADITKDPGGETVLHHVFERLAGASTGIDAAPTITPDAEEPAYFGRDWQVWEQTYYVDVYWELNPNRDVTITVDGVEVTHFNDSGGGTSVVTITGLEEPTP